VGLVRVNADREPEGRPEGCHLTSAGLFLSVSARQDAETTRDASPVRSPNDLREVVQVCGIREMAVTVDHLTRLPGGGGLSKPSRTGRPPSGLAASTMPFDSIPMSFAGFRFATITTERPTSASGS
jgi:hypothetical protein